MGFFQSRSFRHSSGTQIAKAPCYLWLNSQTHLYTERGLKIFHWTCKKKVTASRNLFIKINFPLSWKLKLDFTTVCKHDKVLVAYIKIKPCGPNNSYYCDGGGRGSPADSQPPSVEIYIYAFMNLNNSFSTLCVDRGLRTPTESAKLPPGAQVVFEHK